MSKSRFRRQLPLALGLLVCASTMIVGCTQIGDSGTLEPPTISPEERSTLVQQDAQRSLDEFRAAYPDADVPDVTRVRFVSLNEWPDAMATCLNEEGFEVEAGDGGYGTHIAYDQREPYALATYVCNIKYPVDPKFNIPLNESQLNYLFDYYTGKLTACLEGAGVSVADPPSRQKFIESYGAGGWNPYNSARDAPNWSELTRTCPQVPDGLYG